MVDRVRGFRVAGERDVGETGGVGIAQSVGNHNLPIVWRTGVWFCAVNRDRLPCYVAVAGALVKVDPFDVLFRFVSVG